MFRISFHELWIQIVIFHILTDSEIGQRFLDGIILSLANVPTLPHASAITRGILLWAAP